MSDEWYSANRGSLDQQTREFRQRTAHFRSTAAVVNSIKQFISVDSAADLERSIDSACTVLGPSGDREILRLDTIDRETIARINRYQDLPRDLKWWIISADAVECLKLLETRYKIELFGVEVNEAIKQGSVRCAAYALRNWNASHGTESYARDLVSSAVVGGHLPLLQLLHNKGCSWKTSDASSTARKGDTACLAYLLQTGCPRVAPVTLGAAESGSLECFKLAVESGCEFPRDHILLQRNRPSWRRTVAETIARAVSIDDTEEKREGSMECLRIALSKGCPTDPRTLQYAARNGRFDMVQFLYVDRGIGWWEKEYGENVKRCSRGNFDVLALMRRTGFPWDQSACTLLLYKERCRILPNERSVHSQSCGPCARELVRLVDRHSPLELPKEIVLLICELVCYDTS